MSNYKANNFIKRASRAISYLLVVLLLLGIVGACAYLLMKPNGIYLRYDDKIVTDKTSGLVIPYKACRAQTNLTTLISPSATIPAPPRIRKKKT